MIWFGCFFVFVMNFCVVVYGVEVGIVSSVGLVSICVIGMNCEIL